MTKKYQLVVPASDLNIDFPEHSEYMDESSVEAIQDTIINNGLVIRTENVAVNRECYLNKKALPTLLKTDVKGSNRLYNNLPKSDKISNGDQRLIKLSATQKILSERIQEPRSPLVTLHLQYAESCLISFRDSTELQHDRALSSAKIQEKLPKLKDELIKERNLTSCEYTGEPLDKNSVAHHRFRKSDKPALALDSENLDIINPPPHHLLHSEGAETPEEVDKLADKLDWFKPRRK